MFKPRKEQFLDGGKTGGCARHLDHYVGAIQAREKLLGFFDGRLGVVGEKRRNFQADEPVRAIVSVVNAAQHVGGIANVLHDDFFVNLRDAAAATRQFFQLLGVVLAAADGFLEDSRVRGDAAEAIFVDEALEFAGGQQRTAHLVEPNALTQLMKL